jgi:hypothetical protein
MIEPANVEEDMKATEKYGFPICLVIVCVGTITNSISISFFLRRANENLGSKFLVLLNSVDMVICIYTIFVVVATLELSKGQNLGDDEKQNIVVVWFYSIFELLIEFSGLVTCFLCGLRTISIKWPLYQISKSKVYASFVLVSIYFAIGKLILLHPYVREDALKEYMENRFSITLMISFVNMSVAVLFVLICSSFTARALQKTRPELAGERSDTNDKATKMVLILALLLLIFNSTWLSALAYELTAGNKDSEDLTTMITFLIIATNSTVNPIVYMTRNREMNKYVKQSVSKVINVILCGARSSDTVTAKSEAGLEITSAAV